jgi:hypothetical protein
MDSILPKKSSFLKPCVGSSRFITFYIFIIFGIFGSVHRSGFQPFRSSWRPTVGRCYVRRGVGRGNGALFFPSSVNQDLLNGATEEVYCELHSWFLPILKSDTCM